MTAEPEKPRRRVGVFVCQCGGNISDYVDTEKVRAAVGQEAEVVTSHVEMFACSDASQQTMVNEIREKKLDGLVVCSCSPKLHTATFRAVAGRAGLNPYEYTQVNIREQCSWAHTHDRPHATEKATRLARAGIAKTALSAPLEPLRVDTTPQALVIGAGVTGLRSALALSDLGISVHLIERSKRAGGQVARWGTLFPNDKDGRQVVATLLAEVRKRENIQLYLGTELVEKKGRVGEFFARIKTATGETLPLTVGAIIVATGFEPYVPAKGEFGYGLEGVITLPDLKEQLAENSGRLTVQGHEVRSLAYIYCVGSREETKEGGHTYCSRYCCSATSHVSTVVGKVDAGIRQYHLFRDIRTYGRYESLYEKSLHGGSVFLRYDAETPPEVARDGAGLVVKVKDKLMGGEEVDLHPDLVVLVTGMVPPEESPLNSVLKLPMGKDGFFNEMHIKLKPVETVVNGVFIAGTSQAPKNMAESVASGLAAVSKAGGLLMKGYVNLDPQVAKVDSEACLWCGECLKACPYSAIDEVTFGGKEVAQVNPVLCKGEGACVPVCEAQAVSLEGYTNKQVSAMIEALSKEAVA